MTRPPNFHELFDEPLPEEERDRLLAAHDLMVDAGPPPEVPPWLEQPPTPWIFAQREPRERRTNRFGMLALAATIAVVAFLAGYASSGNHKSAGGFKTEFARRMHGTAAAPAATAAILIGRRDSAGNWPMLLRVSGLKQLPTGGYYELFLTRHGKVAATCGTFRVTKGDTSVRLNAPYDFRQFDGWVVTEHVPRAPEKTLLTT
jgi:hypothetical protein